MSRAHRLTMDEFLAQDGRTLEEICEAVLIAEENAPALCDEGCEVEPDGKPGPPVGTVKTTWHSTLKRAGVPHFPIYNLRHAFCTRLSWVAPDAVIERAMRHTSPETKRIYQLSMVEQVREAMEKANERVYGGRVTVH